VNYTPRRDSLDHLSTPPRRVPVVALLRLMIGRLSFGIVWLLGAGTIVLFAGCIMLSIDEMRVNDKLTDVPVLLAPGLILLASLVWLLAISALYFRVRSTVTALSHGQLQAGRIHRILDRSTGQYTSYESALEGSAEFATSSFASGVMGSMIGRQMNNWPAKVMLEGSTDEIDARLDLGSRIMQSVQDPGTRFLVANQRRGQAIVMTEQFPWLDVSTTGEWVYGMRQQAEDFGFGKSLARTFLLVLVTYALAALGLALNIKPLFNAGINAGIHPIVGAVVVLLFTLTHAVVPVFFYSIFASVIDAAKKHSSAQANPGGLLIASGFFYLHFGCWYGLPILGLASLTGWLSLSWVLLDVLRAGSGQRRWAFLQHGSTSIALVLFVICFSGKNLFPVGILIVPLQALLLTVIEWKGKDLWIKN
jgi:hypothetical protein